MNYTDYGVRQALLAHLNAVEGLVEENRKLKLENSIVRSYLKGGLGWGGIGDKIGTKDMAETAAEQLRILAELRKALK